MNLLLTDTDYMGQLAKIYHSYHIKDFSALEVDVQVLSRALTELEDSCTGVRAMLKELLLSQQEQE